MNCFIAIDLPSSADEVDPPREESAEQRYWTDPPDRCHLCGTLFTMFRRQHHCRLCNVLCCDECSKKRTVIDGNQVWYSMAAMTSSSSSFFDWYVTYPYLPQVRTCDCCFNRAMSRLDAKNREEVSSRLTVITPTITAAAGGDKIKLFGNAVIETESSSPAKKPAATMSKSMNTMSETHNKLLERGEKLSKAAIKSEELSNQANDFAKLAKQLADQQKANRWF